MRVAIKLINSDAMQTRRCIFPKWVLIPSRGGHQSVVLPGVLFYSSDNGGLSVENPLVTGGILLPVPSELNSICESLSYIYFFHYDKHELALEFLTSETLNVLSNGPGHSNGWLPLLKMMLVRQARFLLYRRYRFYNVAEINATCEFVSAHFEQHYQYWKDTGLYGQFTTNPPPRQFVRAMEAAFEWNEELLGDLFSLAD